MTKCISSLLVLIAISCQLSYAQIKVVVPGLDPYQNELTPVKKNGKWGYKNSSGKLVINYKFDNPDVFQDGVAGVTLNGKDGLINTKGEILVPFGKYKSIYLFHEGLAQVIGQNSLYGFINAKGKEVIPCKYVSAGAFLDGLSQVENNNKIGYINKSGKIVVPIIYEDAEDPTLPYVNEIKVEKNGKWGLLSMKGTVLVEPVYDEIHQIVDGMRLVKKDGKYGYMNSKDRLVIKCKYDKAYPFSEGKAFIEYKGKYGTVNKSGKEKWVKN